MDAPAASARATSRGCRTPPSAQTCAPSSRARAAHSSTALNCGLPTPVIIRVVHIAPGPTPTLTMSAPARTRSVTPSGGDHVARRDGHPQAGRPDRPQRADHPLLVAVRGVHDQDVDPGLAPAAVALAATSPLMPMAAPTRSVPAASMAGWYSVARSAPVLVRMPVSDPVASTTGASRCLPSCSRPNAFSGSMLGRQREQVGGHDLAELGEPVHPQAVGLGHHPGRAPVLDDHHRAVRALGQQAERLAGGVGGAECDRRVVDEVAALHPGHHVGHHVRPGCPGGARPCRRGGPRSPPSGGRTPRSCWPPRRGWWCRCRRGGQVHVEPGRHGRSATAPGTRRCRSPRAREARRKGIALNDSARPGPMLTACAGAGVDGGGRS